MRRRSDPNATSNAQIRGLYRSHFVLRSLIAKFQLESVSLNRRSPSSARRPKRFGWIVLEALSHVKQRCELLRLADGRLEKPFRIPTELFPGFSSKKPGIARIPGQRVVSYRRAFAAGGHSGGGGRTVKQKISRRRGCPLRLKTVPSARTALRAPPPLRCALLRP